MIGHYRFKLYKYHLIFLIVYQFNVKVLHNEFVVKFIVVLIPALETINNRL